MHWFDFKKIITYIKEELLATDGILCVTSYIPYKILYNFENNNEFNDKANIHYE